MKKSEFKNLLKEIVSQIIVENYDMDTYDAETDTSMSEPRDRTEPSMGNSLGISQYPQSIVKPVNLDGKQKFFVYSDVSPTALILGYGDTKEDAISNAKTTAAYIKQGGVGNSGDLKDETVKYNFHPDPYAMGNDEGFDKEKMTKINNILVVCEHLGKKINNTIDPTIASGIKQIQRICIDLLQMHGAK